tara:strand:- start:2813 stop:3448 length:636 start_codon:yes stop_codon:yes gene_type:complete
MREYHDLLHVVHEEIDGIGPWLWIAEDWEGYRWPKEDWQNTHRDVWLKHTKNRSVCVQAGGFQGMYPRLLSEHFDMVYTFEPDPLHYFCLVNNCQKDNIIKAQGALGAGPGLIDTVSLCSHNRGMGKVRDGSKIPTFSVDMLGLQDCGFIQLDIEGYERQALRGAERTIRKFHPIISCERKHDNDDVLDIMAELGYKAIDNVGDDTVFAFT